MARRGKRGGATRGRTKARVSGTGTSKPIISGQLAGTNSDLVSQSGGVARTFQATNGSAQNKYGPGSTGSRSQGVGGWNPAMQYAIYGPMGDSANLRSARKGTPSVSINTGGNKGPTNVSTVFPRVLGPKGFGGNYRLSKGY